MEARDRDRGKKKQFRKKFLFRKKKFCKFCEEKIPYIDYKDVRLLQGFTPERGKIFPRRISGTCATHQRELMRAIKRARNIVLRTDVENVGRRGEVIRVADGYARNYLLPKRMALEATPGNLKQIEQERRVRAVHEAREKKEAEALATKISQLSCTIVRKVGENEVLYGSVTNADIADLLEKQGFLMDKRKILLEEPIKSLGIYEVPLKLHPEVVAAVKVWVVKE